MESSGTETVGSPEALQSVLSSIHSALPYARVETDVEAGRAMSFKLADGTTASAKAVGWVQTPHGWSSTYVIESTGVPMLLSITSLRALQATIDVPMSTMDITMHGLSWYEVCS